MVMFEYLQDLSPEKFVAGVRKFCKNHKEIFPNTNLIAYIREYALINQDDFKSDSEAWQIVLNEMSRCGGVYGVPKIDDELIMEAIKGIGWRDLCNSQNIDVIRGQFRKIYEELVKRKKSEILDGEK